jgi:hypothetical protein
MYFMITFFAFGPGVLRFTMDRLLWRTNSATLWQFPAEVTSR